MCLETELLGPQATNQRDDFCMTTKACFLWKCSTDPWSHQALAALLGQMMNFLCFCSNRKWRSLFLILNLTQNQDRNTLKLLLSPT